MNMDNAVPYVTDATELTTQIKQVLDKIRSEDGDNQQSVGLTHGKIYLLIKDGRLHKIVSLQIYCFLSRK